MPNLTIVNARVWTGERERPWADALASEGERLVFVGASADARKRRHAGETLDAHGNLVVPGFVDSHVHFLDGGRGLSSVQLRDAKGGAELADRIAAFAATVPRGTWITRGDWDHHQWGGELPTRRWIDAASPHHPVWITRLDAHMGLANSLALQHAGIDGTTPDVDGGEIVRGTDGTLTGVLKDNAQLLVQRAIPTPSVAAGDVDLQAAMTAVAAHGVTSVHHMGTWEDLAVFRRAHQDGRLRTRIYAAVPIDTWRRLQDTVLADGSGDDWLRIGSLKGFADGSLGSHTAAMFHPYSDAPDHRGLFVNSLEDLTRWGIDADRAGLHVLMHAIGDRAVHEQLNIFEQVRAKNGPRDRRFRIEHAQHVHPADLPRFAALEVIASAQPYHAIDDGRWAEHVIGADRTPMAFPFRDLQAAGARLAFGSDWPVAPPNPIASIDAAVTRRTLDGRNPEGWVPHQRIAVEDALRAYTIGGAFASFEEGTRGTLAAGKLADFVILDRDIFGAPITTISETQVLLTVIGGSIVYRHSRFTT